MNKLQQLMIHMYELAFQYGNTFPCNRYLETQQNFMDTLQELV